MFLKFPFYVRLTMAKSPPLTLQGIFLCDRSEETIAWQTCVNGQIYGIRGIITWGMGPLALGSLLDRCQPPMAYPSTSVASVGHKCSGAPSHGGRRRRRGSGLAGAADAPAARRLAPAFVVQFGGRQRRLRLPSLGRHPRGRGGPLRPGRGPDIGPRRPWHCGAVLQRRDL